LPASGKGIILLAQRLEARSEGTIVPTREAVRSEISRILADLQRGDVDSR